MKSIMLFNVLILISSLFVSCDKNEIQSEFNIQGEWYPVNSYGDTISFKKEFAILSKVEYHYTIENDTIVFEYAGPLYMPIIPSKHHFFYNKEKSVLLIENKNNRLPALGSHEQIELIKSDLKERIAGNWLNSDDFNDTLVFINSYEMEYKNNTFKYILCKDSIEVISQIDDSSCNGNYYISLINDSMNLNIEGCNFQDGLIFIKQNNK